MSDEETTPRRRWTRVLGVVLGGLAVLIVLAGAGLTIVLRGSLPDLMGEMSAPGLKGPVTIERDAQGVPTLTADDRVDLAYAAGFLHGQERFFQMDLTRRAAAGELSALFGERALKFDQSRRIHRSRHVAEQAIAALPAEHVALVEAYARGANAGLGALGTLPFEYQLLGQDPRPWAPVDTGLVILAMFYDLQDESARYDRMRGVMREALPPAMADWLVPRGNARWDAPIDGEAVPIAEMPGPEVVDLRTMPQWQALRDGAQAAVTVDGSGWMIGSNSWAVAGSRSRHGGAMVANDMHLNLRIPIIWYRAAWNWKVDGEARRIDGVTLPGGPVVVVGSNGHVAWGFTNSQIDTVDAIPLELEGDGYRTADGVQPFTVHRETIEVADGKPVEFEYRWTRWGPVVDAEHGRPTAVRWIGHEPGAVDLGVIELEEARTLDDALSAAQRGGTPPQNFVVADASGRIAWTIMGFIPERFGPTAQAPAEEAPDTPADPPEAPADTPEAPADTPEAPADTPEAPADTPDAPADTPDAPADAPAAAADAPAAPAEPPPPPLFHGYDGRFPRSWADGAIGWKGRLPPERYPAVIDPPEGLIWTGNARIVGGERYAALGEAYYALGARQQQIRDGLRARAAKGKLDESDMLAIQLDDRAVFLAPWRSHLISLLGDAESTPLRARALHHLENGWTGRASVDSVGYRLARAMRLGILEGVFAALTAPAGALHPEFTYMEKGAEGPLWQMITEEPAHLLHPGYQSWTAWQLALIDVTLAELTAGESDPAAALDTRTWGEVNAMAVRHPMAGALPVFGDALSAPKDPLPGDSHMPRYQSADNGASERLAVSPGKEEQGYLLLPGGQSGHPLSENFLDQYAAWAKGEPRSFRPGPVRHTLTLKPGD